VFFDGLGKTQRMARHRRGDPYVVALFSTPSGIAAKLILHNNNNLRNEFYYEGDL
jgi:hypothetical protein